MATLNDLKKYLNYEFSSGCYTGDDYKSFERKYINYLKSLAKENGWELVNVGKNHYEFSAFFKYEDKYVTWCCVDKTKYHYGHYYSDYKLAVRNLFERAQESIKWTLRYLED